MVNQETIRQIIDKYRNRLASQDEFPLSPEEASKILVELSAYSGNINVKLLDAQMAYNLKLSECLKEIKSVAKAQVAAGCSEEYRNLQEIKGYKELNTDLLRSLKYLIRSLGDEYEHSRNL